MARHGATGPGDPALIAALLQGKTIAEAAQAAGVSPRTVNRRLADPTFVRELRQARQRVLNRAIHLLLEGTAQAAATLRWLVVHADQDSIKLAAARSILDYAFKGIETMDLAERVAALEEAQQPPARRTRWGR